MFSGILNGQLLRGGLSLVAALLLTSAAMAQDVAVGEEGVMYAVDPIFVIDPMPVFEDDQGTDDGTTIDEVTDDGTTIDEGTDDGTTTDEGTDDEGTVEEWVWDEDDTIISIDDGLCIDIDCAPVDKTDPSDGEVVIYDMDGGRPEDCPQCRDLTSGVPDEIYQMSASGPLVTETVTEMAPAAKPRRSRAAPSTPSNAAECLALYPQLPWLCEWQNTTGL